ncbi:hypothetical protein LLEC1_05917 [Akanthomyces lecanii]|uniref:Thymidylate kinase n=1 Tax=Cordyceps confragosa TaxID=2714763 RepID=A0A179IK55_CORDF|nr:hypothetical protein LLEC1_05917 [Akanthomyces lecanii]
MAAIARQPFAPLDGARLQGLSSTKNRQNGKHPNTWPPTRDVKRAPWTEHSANTHVARSGLLSTRRRPAGPLSRMDPPSFSVAGSAKSKPWSVDGALKSTIKPTNRHGKSKSRPSRGLDIIGSKAAWHFDIHEDTPEQEMTNLLQHSTCVLDISSDEETSAKKEREFADGCNKENIPPAGHVGPRPRPSRAAPCATAMDSDRDPLGALNARDFYAEGCDETSVFLVDEDEETEVEDNSAFAGFVFAPKLKPAALEVEPKKLDELVEKPAEGSGKAAVLEPIEGAEESFELWESGSAKDEDEAEAKATA